MTAAIERINNNLALPQVDQAAILKHLGINASDPAAQALMLVCQRYELDPILKHALLIKGRLYVTRDGLMHVAHRSGVFDGMEVLDQGETPTHYTAKVAVWRKDMNRPFSYIGRYPKSGQIAKDYGPEMAVKVAEVMCLRRAFDVALGAAEERWDEEAQRELQQAEHSAPAQQQARTVDVTREVAQAAGVPTQQANPNAEALAAWKDKLGKIGGRLAELNLRAEAAEIMGRFPFWKSDVAQASAAYEEMKALGISKAQPPTVSESDTTEAVVLITDAQRKALMGQLKRAGIPNTTEARSAFYGWLISAPDGTRTNSLTTEDAQGLIDLLSAMDADEIAATAAQFSKEVKL